MSADLGPVPSHCCSAGNPLSLEHANFVVEQVVQQVEPINDV